jgi:putative membrane protein
VIQGLSINGTWPAGLLVALGVVLLTILVVRIGGRRARRGNPRRGDPGRGEGRRQGPDGSINSRQVLEEMYARGELSSTDYQKRLRVLRRGA